MHCFKASMLYEECKEQLSVIFHTMLPFITSFFEQRLDKNILTLNVTITHGFMVGSFLPLSSEWRLRSRVEFSVVSVKLLFLAILSTCPHLLPLLNRSVQAGTEAPKCCIGQAWNPINRQSSTVYWADIVQRFVRFPLSQVTELGETQLLRLKTWEEKEEKFQPLIRHFYLMLQQLHLTLRLDSYLYFSSGSEGHVACGIGVLSLLLCCLSPYQGREGRGQVPTKQRLLWRNI